MQSAGCLLFGLCAQSQHLDFNYVLLSAAARARRDAGERRVTEKELQEENGGLACYSQDLRKLWDLKDPAWKYGIMPEIYNGHNVSPSLTDPTPTL